MAMANDRPRLRTFLGESVAAGDALCARPENLRRLRPDVAGGPVAATDAGGRGK